MTKRRRSRDTYELEEQAASAIREEQLRSEYAIAAEQLLQELSAQQFQHLEKEQMFFAQARLRTALLALSMYFYKMRFFPPKFRGGIPLIFFMDLGPTALKKMRKSSFFY